LLLFQKAFSWDPSSGVTVNFGQLRRGVNGLKLDSFWIITGQISR